MTLIIGIDVEVDGKEYKYMAGDHLGSNGFAKEIYKKSKIFTRDKYAFGYTSSFRLGQILEFEGLPTGQPSGEIHDWSNEKLLYTTFVKWVRKSLEENGYAKIESNKERGGYFLFYNGNHIYTVQDDYSLLDVNDGLSAVGSGSYHARAIMLAYMQMVKDKKVDFDPKYLIRLIYDTVSNSITTVSKSHDVINLLKM